MCFNGAHSQENHFRNFSVRNGLPSSETYSVFQDSKGYIWIAGDAGVSKYNGHKFENYTTLEGLADNTIFDFYEDKKERIWFLSYSGNLSYYEKGEIKKIFPNGELGLFLQNQFVKNIFIDSFDNLWIATDYNLYKLNLINTKFDCNAVNTPEGYYIKQIEDAFLFANKLETKSDTTAINFTIDLEEKVISEKLPYKLLVYAKMGLSINSQKQGLFYNNQMLVGFNLETGEINQNFSTFQTISAYADKKDRFWIGTRNEGVYLYESDPVNSKFTKQFLNGKSVVKIFQDNEGGYWFATLEEGVYYISESQVSNILENDKPLKKAMITAFRDSMIYGLGAEVGAFLAKQNYFEEINFVNNGSNTPTSIFVDSKNRVWFGIIQSSFIYYPETNKKKKNPFGNMPWTAITEDNYGEIWLSSYSSLYKVCSSKLKICDTINLIKRPFVLKTGLNNELFIGSIDGLWKYENDRLIYLGNKHPYLRNRIDDLLILKDGSIILATKGAGLGIWNNGKIKVINTANGLESNFCKSLAMDKDGNIWVGTNRGLSQLVYKNDQWIAKSLTKRLGLIDNEISSITFCNDKLWIANNTGISYYNANELLKEEIIAPVFIKQISTVDSTFSPRERKLELDYKDNLLTIDFEALTYVNPTNTTFLYRLAGLDPKWRKTSNRSIQYSHLPPGEYSFEVTIFVQGANTIDSSAKFPFSVVPPFWDLWWFKALTVIIIICIIVGIYRFQNKWYRKKINRKYEYEKRIANIELRALRSQLNPHFIFNCLGTVQNLILKNKNETAEIYITKFSRLLRTVLAGSSENVISLEQELETSKFYIELEALRFPHGFKYNLRVEPGLNISEIDIPPMLIQPFIENAIWHGLSHKLGDKTLDIVVSKRENSIISLTITDNGIGRQKSQQLNQELKKFKSFGINLINDRIKVSNTYSEKKIKLYINDLTDSENKASGTVVTILIPE